MPAAPTTAAYPDVFATHVAQFAHADALRARINAKKNQDAALWDTIVKRLRVD